MKKAIALSILTILVANTIFSCSKKAKDEIILPVTLNEKLSNVNKPEPLVLDYSVKPVKVNYTKGGDTPYGKGPIKIIPIAKVDTPYGN